MNRILLSLMLPLSGCMFTSDGNAIEVQNFRAGLICPHPLDSPEGQSRNSQVCFETDTVYITGQGTCTYDGEDKQCTWYGYEFDYANASTDDEISCIVTSSQHGVFGNPQRIEKDDTTTFEYSISLSSGEGHHYNPQYSVFSYSTDDEPVDNHETVCSIDGQELFRFRFRLIFPEQPEK